MSAVSIIIIMHTYINKSLITNVPFFVLSEVEATKISDEIGNKYRTTKNKNAQNTL